MQKDRTHFQHSNSHSNSHPNQQTISKQKSYLNIGGEVTFLITHFQRTHTVFVRLFLSGASRLSIREQLRSSSFAATNVSWNANQIKRAFRYSVRIFSLAIHFEYSVRLLSSTIWHLDGIQIPRADERSHRNHSASSTHVRICRQTCTITMITFDHR